MIYTPLPPQKSRNDFDILINFFFFMKDSFYCMCLSVCVIYGFSMKGGIRTIPLYSSFVVEAYRKTREILVFLYQLRFVDMSFFLNDDQREIYSLLFQTLFIELPS